MDFLSKEQIHAAKARRYAIVEVPTIGRMRLASPTAAQSMRLTALNKRREAGEEVTLEMMELALLCVVDSEGHRVFTAEDAKLKMDEWSTEACLFIANEVVKL